MELAEAVDSNPKSERLEARVTPDQKKLFERAAHLLGWNLTAFMVNSLEQAATKVVRERDSISLSVRDQEAFVTALLSSPVPVGRLAKAIQRRNSRRE